MKHSDLGSKIFGLFISLLACVVFMLTAMQGEGFVVRGQNKSAAEFQSLLNMRFYEGNGGFLVENVQTVFPPQSNLKGMLSINKASGEEVLSLPLRMEPFGNFPAFANLVPDGDPGNIRIGQSGDFVMTIKIGGEVITRMSFSLKEERGNDPYNPQTRFVRDGLWKDLAYVSVPMDESSKNIAFSWWISLRELPAGMSNPRVNVHLMQGAQEIGITRSPIVPSYIDWQFFSKELVTPSGIAPGNPHYLTMADLKKDGEYTIVLKANGQAIKSYRFQVKGGQILRPEESRIDYEPHVNFISPRFIDTSAGSSSRYHMRDMYWMKRTVR